MNHLDWHQQQDILEDGSGAPQVRGLARAKIVNVDHKILAIAVAVEVLALLVLPDGERQRFPEKVKFLRG